MTTDVGIVLMNIVLLVMLFIIGIAIARMRNLFAIVMLAGVYSLLSAAWFVMLDAVDVAFTEAAVGAGISTVLMLGAMLLTVRTAKAVPRASQITPLVVVVVTGLMLVYASIDLPLFGDAMSAPNAYIGQEYLERTNAETAVPNVVTAVLASYRGFDTLGETAVVFAAGLSVALLLGFGERSLSSSGRRQKGDKS